MARKHSWRQNLQDLAALSETLIRTQNPEELYSELTSRIARIVGARACLIALYDSSAKKFTTQHPHFGIREKDGIALDYQVTPEYHHLWNFRAKGVLVSNQAKNDPRLFSYFVRNYSVRSVLLAPMLVQDNLLGLIALMNKRGGFTEFDSYLGSIIAYQTGIILTNARLIEEEKRRNEQILMLNETARQINSSLVLEDIIDHAIRIIQSTLRMEEVAFYLPCENDTLLELKACSGTFHKQIQAQGYIQSVDVGLLGWTFRNGKTFYCSDSRKEPLFLPHPLIPTSSEVCIPVQREGKVIAVLNVESPDCDAFNRSDILTLETLADQLAIAFHNSMNYERERKHNQQMLLLSEITSELALIGEKDQIVKTTVERIKQRFHYYFVAIAWVNREENALTDWYYLPRFEPMNEFLPQEVPLERGITGRVAMTGKSILAPDTSKSPDYYNVLEEVRSEMAVPVIVGDKVVAILDLQSDQVNSFDESDLMIMETLAYALSTAFQNAESYQRLQETNEKLVRTSQIKDEIVQIVAHDFRSPLTVIRGYMDFLLKKGKWTDDRQKLIMETVSQQAQRLQRLAEETLKASRLDSGEIAFTYERLDLQLFLQRWIFPLTDHHEFILSIEDDLPLIKGDAGRLQEVLENLVSNAVKYSPQGGKIVVSARKVLRSDLPSDSVPERGSLFAKVSVADEGIGIPPEQKEKLFQRFSRLHEDKRMEGIGLGLYIAKKMMEAHGGRIWLEETERGSCFSFVIPAAEVKSDEKSVLIFDEEEHTRHLLYRALDEKGWDILTARDEKEAKDKFERFHPPLMILELDATDHSLLEWIRELKASGIRIIVFTGKPEMHLGDEFSEVPVIYKNSGVHELVKKVEG